MATAKRPQKRTDAKTDKTVRALGKQVQVEASAREAVDSRVTAHKASIAGFIPQTFSSRVPASGGGADHVVGYGKASYHATGVEVFISRINTGAIGEDHDVVLQNLTDGTSETVTALAAEFVNGRWSGSIVLELQAEDEYQVGIIEDSVRGLIVTCRLTGDKPRREREIARDGG